MLAHPTQERLIALGLGGMAKAFDDQRRQPDIMALSFEERLALLLDRETTDRENKRLTARLRFAALRQTAVVEDVDLRSARGLDRALFQKLAAEDWIDRKQNLLILGPDRRRQVVARLRPRSQGMPGRSLGRLPSRAPAARGIWRWPAVTGATPACSRRSAGFRP